MSFVYKSLLAILLLVVTSTVTLADAVISYGSLENGTRFITLAANQADQQVQLFASGFTSVGGVDGLELNLQIGDGGSEVGGTDVGPVFQTVDLTNGTVFSSANPNQADPVTFLRARQSTVDTSALINADGVIATLTLDTTGLQSGEFEFRLTGVAGSFDTTFFNSSSEVTTVAPNGIIRIVSVPEPTTAFALIVPAIVLVHRRRRN